MSSQRTGKWVPGSGAIYRPVESDRFEERSMVKVEEVFFHYRTVPDRRQESHDGVQVQEVARFEIRLNQINAKITTDHFLITDWLERFNFVAVNDSNPIHLLITAIAEPYTGTVEFAPFPYVPRPDVQVIVALAVADEFGVAVADEFGNLVTGEVP